VFSFGNEVRCKEIGGGENGAEILVYGGVLYGVVVSKFSSFEEGDLTNPVRLFSSICLKSPEPTSALFKLICNFEIDQVCREASKILIDHFTVFLDQLSSKPFLKFISEAAFIYDLKMLHSK